MLKEGQDCDEEDFIKAIIENRDKTIRRIENRISQKASYLKYSLVTLGGAALLTIVDILINVNV